MADRIELIRAFEDTQRRMMADPELQEQTRRMMAGTLLFQPGYEAFCLPAKKEMAEIEVCEDTTFHCAQREILAGKTGNPGTAGANEATVTGNPGAPSNADASGTPSNPGAAGAGDTVVTGNPAGRIAVLNFANAYSPGGGVRQGAMAQEECLCRSSNLYAALTMRYLSRNYYKWNGRYTGDMGTDAVIWSPGVTVFKSDDAVPVLLEEPFQVDVLTCAAPYYDTRKKHPVTRERLREVFDSRIRNILEVAVSRLTEAGTKAGTKAGTEAGTKAGTGAGTEAGTGVLILGAFGCGAFNNPPELVAECFRRQLVERGYGRYFRKVVFAIKRNQRGNDNLEAFREVLS